MTPLYRSCRGKERLDGGPTEGVGAWDRMHYAYPQESYIVQPVWLSTRLSSEVGPLGLQPLKVFFVPHSNVYTIYIYDIHIYIYDYIIIYLYHIDRQRSLACDCKHEIVRASCDLTDSCFVFLCYIIFLPKQHFVSGASLC